MVSSTEHVTTFILIPKYQLALATDMNCITSGSTILYFAYYSWNYFTFTGADNKLPNPNFELSIYVPLLLDFCYPCVSSFCYYSSFHYNGLCSINGNKRSRRFSDDKSMSIPRTSSLSFFHFLLLSFFPPVFLLLFFLPVFFHSFCSYSLAFLLDWLFCHCLYYLWSSYEQGIVIHFH